MSGCDGVLPGALPASPPDSLFTSQKWMYFLSLGEKKSASSSASQTVHAAKVVSKAPAAPRADAAPARSSTLMRAERGSAPVHLSAPQKHLLGRALAEGGRLHNVLEDGVIAFGRWVLVEVFDNDAQKALDEWGKNPVWLEMVRRAGGPSNDKRLTNQSWQRLDVGRKQLLLPLREVPRLRQAAQHVMKWNLTHAKTREYVTQLRAEDGRKPIVRLTRVACAPAKFAAWRRNTLSSLSFTSCTIASQTTSLDFTATFDPAPDGDREAHPRQRHLRWQRP